MKILFSLSLALILGFRTMGQVVSDRVGYINSAEVISDNGLQIETGIVVDQLEYSSGMIGTETKTLLRQGASDIHEFRVGYQKELATTNFNYEWFTVGVKLKVANCKKLKIASIATWGFDPRTVLPEGPPDFYLQLAVPATYHATDNFSIQTQLKFNHLYEQSDINLAFNHSIGEFGSIQYGMVNQFLLVERGDHSEKSVWNELVYANFSGQFTYGRMLAMDFGVLMPFLTGKEQRSPSNGLVLNGGITILIPHKPWRNKKLKIESEVY